MATTTYYNDPASYFSQSASRKDEGIRSLLNMILMMNQQKQQGQSDLFGQNLDIAKLMQDIQQKKLDEMYRTNIEAPEVKSRTGLYEAQATELTLSPEEKLARKKAEKEMETGIETAGRIKEIETQGKISERLAHIQAKQDAEEKIKNREREDIYRDEQRFVTITNPIIGTVDELVAEASKPLSLQEQLLKNKGLLKDTGIRGDKSAMLFLGQKKSELDAMRLKIPQNKKLELTDYDQINKIGDDVNLVRAGKLNPLLARSLPPELKKLIKELLPYRPDLTYEEAYTIFMKEQNP